MTFALRPAWILVLCAAGSAAGDETVTRRVEQDVLEPSLRAVDDAARALGDPGSRQAAADISRQWVTPAADQAGKGMMSAARHLGDPHASGMPDLWLPERPGNPLAGRTIDFIGAAFVDPLAKHAHDAAMTASRRLGSLETYATDALLPELHWSWPDFLTPTQPDTRNSGTAPDPRVRSRFPAQPKESRRDSLKMIKTPRGSQPAQREKLKPVEAPSFRSPTPGTFQPLDRGDGD
ncbi:MAG: hypothetical protein HZB91_02370 [Elusimicrobia bacterium]|nr:hypothetical protein [Elusimicrobiota bacterium]